MDAEPLSWWAITLLVLLTLLIWAFCTACCLFCCISERAAPMAPAEPAGLGSSLKVVIENHIYEDTGIQMVLSRDSSRNPSRCTSRRGSMTNNNQTAHKVGSGRESMTTIVHTSPQVSARRVSPQVNSRSVKSSPQVSPQVSSRILKSSPQLGSRRTSPQLSSRRGSLNIVGKPRNSLHDGTLEVPMPTMPLPTVSKVSYEEVHDLAASLKEQMRARGSDVSDESVQQAMRQLRGMMADLPVPEVSPQTGGNL